jgi:hypothetical protein
MTNIFDVEEFLVSKGVDKTYIDIASEDTLYVDDDVPLGTFGRTIEYFNRNITITCVTGLEYRWKVSVED